MKSFGTVLKFEIMHYLKNKTFQVTTAILVIGIIVGLSIPTIMDQFNKDDTSDGTESSDTVVTYGLYDPDGIIEETDFLASTFYLGELKGYESLDTMKSDIENTSLAGGFIMSGSTNYQYVLLNNEMMDNGLNAFNYAYGKTYQKQALEAKGIAYEEISSVLDPAFQYDVQVLGKDSAANYGYTYILVFGLYFMIIMYGQLIATSVASEKSNRTMEILVTSTRTTYLIFGKVIGGAIASVLQFALIIGVGKAAYAFNGAAWNGKLDMIFNIPSKVLMQFAVFGILGYLFFTFIFGALGALVSRTEDVNASATPVTLIFVAVFMIAVTGMQNTEGIVLLIASYIPFSSFLAMFVRVSMGSVAWYEVAISVSLLLGSTIFMGWLAAKIYRMGTLMYGNPVKLKDIPKILKAQ